MFNEGFSFSKITKKDLERNGNMTTFVEVLWKINRWGDRRKWFSED
jgi:hypothetical protein